MSNTAKGRSRVTNGRSLFLGKVPTTGEARRLKDIIEHALNARGGVENVPIEFQVSIRAYAGLALLLEQTLARLAAGDDISAAELGKLSRDLIHARRAMDPPAKARTATRRRAFDRSAYRDEACGSPPIR